MRQDGFTLLVGSRGEDWVVAAVALSDELAIAIDVYAVGADTDNLDADGAWATLRGHDDHGAVLVRPDSHVVFRSASATSDHREVLGNALRTALARDNSV